MDDQKAPAQGSSITPESEGLTLPPDLELQEKIGAGRMCVVYKARFQGETVALKVYTAKAAKWYKNKLGKNIAVFEMLQNRAYRQVPALLPYTARPIRVIGQDGKYSLSFMQEFIEGKSIEELGQELGGLPEGLFQVGQMISKTSEEEGLKGIEQFMKNTLVRKHAGQWFPVILDFKHIPEEAPKKKSGGSLFSFMGKSNINPNDAEYVKRWRALSGKLEKAAG